MARKDLIIEPFANDGSEHSRTLGESIAFPRPIDIERDISPFIAKLPMHNKQQMKSIKCVSAKIGKGLQLRHLAWPFQIFLPASPACASVTGLFTQQLPNSHVRDPVTDEPHHCCHLYSPLPQVTADHNALLFPQVSTLSW
jgi:hypothetical protein